MAKHLDSFFKQYKLLKYKKGETIIRPEDISKYAFYIDDGYVKQFTISKEGVEFTVQIYSPGTYFPISIAENIQSSENYFVCITDCQVYKAPREALLQYIKDKPELLFEVAHILSSGLHEFLIRIESLVFGNARYKLISTLLYLASNFGEVKGSGILIRYWFTHQDIANLSGISREQVSRELAELLKQDLIVYQDRLIFIKNINKLENYLSSGK